jgi:hypothetical protein
MAPIANSADNIQHIHSGDFVSTMRAEALDDLEDVADGGEDDAGTVVVPEEPGVS